MSYPGLFAIGRCVACGADGGCQRVVDGETARLAGLGKPGRNRQGLESVATAATVVGYRGISQRRVPSVLSVREERSFGLVIKIGFW